MDERHFRRIDKFDGVESKWKEWSFQMKTAIASVNPKVRALLEEIQKDPKGVDWDLMFGNLNDHQVDQMSAELYGTWVLMTTGEALTVVRGVAGGNGWHAWQQLVVRYNPKTPARALVAMMSVMQPRKVKDVRELQGAVQEWEVKVKTLQTEHEVKLDERIAVALLTSMLPTDFQDYVFQWSDGKATYPDIRDKLMALAMNRASLGRPAPMEVDRVWAGEEWEEWPEEGGGTECDDKVEVDFVGETCLRCGGHGHYQ